MHRTRGTASIEFKPPREHETPPSDRQDDGHAADSERAC